MIDNSWVKNLSRLSLRFYLLTLNFVKTTFKLIVQVGKMKTGEMGIFKIYFGNGKGDDNRLLTRKFSAFIDRMVRVDIYHIF